MFNFFKPRYIAFFSKGTNDEGQKVEVEVTLPVNSFRLAEVFTADKYFVELLAQPIGWEISKETYMKLRKFLHIKSTRL